MMASFSLFHVLLLTALLAADVQAAVGDIVCRYNATSPEAVNYYTCTELALRYETDLEMFFTLNPSMDRDCATIKPNTEYCIKGCMVPWPYFSWMGADGLIVLDYAQSQDGFCGPNHGGTSCLGTAKQCCNGETWQCGNT